MSSDDPFTYDPYTSLSNDTKVNMSKVELHDAVLDNCSVNGSEYNNPICDKTGNGISLLAPLSMMTLGITGNILGLVIIYSSRPENHSRRTVFFVMLSGLAWTDLAAQFCVSPVAILVYINNLKWIGGAHLCRYHGFVMTSFGLITPLVVCCMSIERLMAIRFSYFYAKHVTQKRAQIAFFMCLLVPFVFSLFPIVGFGSYELQFPSSWCFLNFHRETTLDAIYAGFFSCINISAILIMLFCNTSVVITLFIMRQSRKVNNSPSFDRRISVTQISNGGGAVIRNKKHSDMEAQMIWFLCLITIAFSVCWLPFNVHILSNQFTKKTNHVLDLVFVRMVSSNQILDPWLYVIFRKSSIVRLLKHIKRLIHGKRMSKEDVLNEALRNEGLRKRSFFRSSTIEVTTLNRTVANGHSRIVNNYMEDNLENLKKILENERKLGREIYSRISERTEYSESATQQENSDRSRSSSVSRELGYGSVRSHNNPSDILGQSKNNVIEEGDSDNSELEIKYDDININSEKFPFYQLNHHQPCTYTKSCPIQGSNPIVLELHDQNESASATASSQHPIGRQMSMPTSISLHSVEDSQHSSNPVKLCPSTVDESNSSYSLTYEKTDDKSKSTGPGQNGKQNNHKKKLNRGLSFDEGLDYDSNDDVFETTDMESAILFSGERDCSSQNRNQSKNNLLKTRESVVSDSSLPEGPASDSQGLLS